MQRIKKGNKMVSIVLLLSLFSLNLTAQNQVVGKWLSEDKEGITEIYAQNGKYFGKITCLKKPNDAKGVPFTDTENPNSALKKQPLLNLVILKDFYFQSEKWKGGTIYDPQSGKTYTCTFWLTDNNTLKVRGYWTIFYQTQTWSRTQ
jgi:uncharacterized protein (DUF2147 family)